MSQVVAMLQSTEHVGFDLFSPHPTEYVDELLPMAIEQRWKKWQCCREMSQDLIFFYFFAITLQLFEIL